MKDTTSIIATFDTPDTALRVTKLLNVWFTWILEGSSDEIDDLTDLFDDFGLVFDDYQDTDEVDWNETPEIDLNLKGTEVIIRLEGKGAIIDTIKDLLHSVGAYDVTVDEEE